MITWFVGYMTLAVIFGAVMGWILRGWADGE
jgi:hypothetical protein